MKTLTQITRATRTIVWCSNQLVLANSIPNREASALLPQSSSKESTGDVSWRAALSFSHGWCTSDARCVFPWHSLVYCCWALIKQQQLVKKSYMVHVSQFMVDVHGDILQWKCFKNWSAFVRGFTCRFTVWEQLLDMSLLHFLGFLWVLLFNLLLQWQNFLT